MLTSALGWRSVLFVNVPIGIAAVLLTPGLVAESRGEVVNWSFELAGAATATGGLAALVYALVRATTVGCGSPETIGVIAATLVLPLYLQKVLGDSAMTAGISSPPLAFGVAVAGLASGLVNTSQQVGGALGLAVLSPFATTRTNHLAATHHPLNHRRRLY